MNIWEVYILPHHQSIVKVEVCYQGRMRPPEAGVPINLQKTFSNNLVLIQNTVIHVPECDDQRDVHSPTINGLISVEHDAVPAKPKLRD